MCRWALVIAFLVCTSPTWGRGGGHAGFAGRGGHGIGPPGRFSGPAGQTQPIGHALRPAPSGGPVAPPPIRPHVINVQQALHGAPGPGEPIAGPHVIILGAQPAGVDRSSEKLPPQGVMVFGPSEIAPHLITIGALVGGTKRQSGELPPEPGMVSACRPVSHGYRCNWP